MALGMSMVHTILHMVRWYFYSFVHSDVMENLSRALGTNLSPSHSIELLKTLGKGMGEVDNHVKF